MHQLLWIETLLKLAGGAIHLIAPLTAIRLLGLPPAGSGFWPRLLGAVLIGIGGAAYIEGAWDGVRGLGLAGLIVINIASAAVLGAAAVLGGPSRTRRGTFVLWSLVVALIVLVLFEIAHV